MNLIGFFNKLVAAIRTKESTRKKTFYEVLQVAPDTDVVMIDVAYRKLSQCHLETSPDSRSAKDHILREACQVLSDPVIRAAYDAALADSDVSVRRQANHASPDPSDALPVAKRDSAKKQWILSAIWLIFILIPISFLTAWILLITHSSFVVALVVAYAEGALLLFGLWVIEKRTRIRKREKPPVWYVKPAERGYAEAQRHLALMYFGNDCVAQDYRKAVFWSRKAAEQGNGEALYYLGLLYAHGWGVPKDLVQAYMWHHAGASMDGFCSGLNEMFRDHLARHMPPAQIEEARATATAWLARPKR